MFPESKQASRRKRNNLFIETKLTFLFANLYYLQERYKLIIAEYETTDFYEQQGGRAPNIIEDVFLIACLL